MPGRASPGHHPGFRAGVLPPAGQLNRICCDGCSEETEACTRDCAGPGDTSSLAGRGHAPSRCSAEAAGREGHPSRGPGAWIRDGDLGRACCSWRWGAREGPGREPQPNQRGPTSSSPQPLSHLTAATSGGPERAVSRPADRGLQPNPPPITQLTFNESLRRSGLSCLGRVGDPLFHRAGFLSLRAVTARDCQCQSSTRVGIGRKRLPGFF